MKIISNKKIKKIAKKIIEIERAKEYFKELNDSGFNEEKSINDLTEQLLGIKFVCAKLDIEEKIEKYYTKELKKHGGKRVIR